VNTIRTKQNMKQKTT